MSTRCLCRPLCGSVDILRISSSCIRPIGGAFADSSCRTSCFRRSPSLPILSLCSSTIACSICKSSRWSRRSIWGSWNSTSRVLLVHRWWLFWDGGWRSFDYILFAFNPSTGDSLSFVSSLLNLSPNLVIEPQITPHCQRLTNISWLAISTS